MSFLITVLPQSDSFCDIWEQLFVNVGLELRTKVRKTDTKDIFRSCGVIISAGGVENQAPSFVREVVQERVPPIVVVGVESDYRLAIQIMKEGAVDYFALPGDIATLRAWIIERVEVALAEYRNRSLTADERSHYDFSRFIGSNLTLLAAFDRAAKIIPRGCATVLITGETGTGKELLARAIHHNGPRASLPFVEINCAALPANLLEAELFGYEPGAFTDARSPKPGLFEAADGGSLFLDEIGDLSFELQGKLLRVLEEKRVRRLGSLREISVDVRVIAATNVDIHSAMREGHFRPDLYYRLNVAPIHLPSLHERGDDIFILADHFLQRFSAEYEEPMPKWTAEVRRAVLMYSWPGNVRELRNSMERAVLFGNGELKLRDVFVDGLAGDGRSSGTIPFPASMEAISIAAAHAMVDHCGGNKSHAADALGISRKHLYSLLSDRPRIVKEPPPEDDSSKHTDDHVNGSLDDVR